MTLRRRTFSQAAAAVAATAVVPRLANAQLKGPVAGTDYQVLETRAQNPC